MHVTQFEQQQMHTIGAREDDFRDFSHEILRPVSPYAILISGDLVDAKTHLKRGQQNESEWQVKSSDIIHIVCKTLICSIS
jgi:hypothetical protein